MISVRKIIREIEFELALNDSVTIRITKFGWDFESFRRFFRLALDSFDLSKVKIKDLKDIDSAMCLYKSLKSKLYFDKVLSLSGKNSKALQLNLNNESDCLNAKCNIKNIGTIISRVARSRKMSLVSLSEKLGINKATFYTIAQNKLKINNGDLYKLCEILNVDLEYLKNYSLKPCV